MRPIACVVGPAALLAVALAVAPTGVHRAGAAPDAGQSGGVAPLEQTFQEIHILNQLRELRATPAQLQALLEAARQVEAERRKIIAERESPEVRAAAEAVRKALLEDRPPDELGPLFEQLEMAQQKLGEPGDAEARLETLARSLARGFAARLTAQQIVRLQGEREQEPGGPLAEALNHVRRMREREQEVREFIEHFSRRTSLEITQDVARAGKVKEELAGALTRIAALPDAEFATKGLELYREMEKIVAQALGSPLGVIQWHAETRIRELLIHPRLAPVIEERLKSAKG